MPQPGHPQPHRDHARRQRIEDQQPPVAGTHAAEIEAQRLPQPEGRHQQQAPEVDQRADALGRNVASELLADHHVDRLAGDGAEQQQVADHAAEIAAGMLAEGHQRDATHRTGDARADAQRDALLQQQPREHGHHRRDRRHDHAGRQRRGACHAEQHAHREEKVAEEGFEEQQPAVVRAELRFTGLALHPSGHRQRGDAEAQPGQQEDRQHQHQDLGQADVAAHQRHAGGQAQVGQPGQGMRDAGARGGTHRAGD